ncbi:hypothetical protein LP418_08880 [Nocardioides sp. B-3]|nr:hypothetical protein LP418_08880 [Nocardioides sp. B-3]
MKKLFIRDVTLRDGMHAIRHRIEPGRVGEIVAALGRGRRRRHRGLARRRPLRRLAQLRSRFAHRLGHGSRRPPRTSPTRASPRSCCPASAPSRT